MVQIKYHFPLSAHPKVLEPCKKLWSRTVQSHPNSFRLGENSPTLQASIFKQPQRYCLAFKAVITRQNKHLRLNKQMSIEKNQSSHTGDLNRNGEMEPQQMNITSRCTYHPSTACTRRRYRGGEHLIQCQNRIGQLFEGKQTIIGSKPSVLRMKSYNFTTFDCNLRNWALWYNYQYFTKII